MMAWQPPRSGPRRGPPLKLTFVVCALLTALHLGAWVVAGGASTGSAVVSGLEVGDRIAEDLLRHLRARPSGACHLLVSLDPLCPSCMSAAERERLAHRAGWAGEVVWVARAASPDLSAFERLVTAPATIHVDARLYGALEVHGTPGLYVVHPAGDVRWVGPYRGDEEVARLIDRCVAAPPSDVSTGGVEP